MVSRLKRIAAVNPRRRVIFAHPPREEADVWPRGPHRFMQRGVSGPARLDRLP